MNHRKMKREYQDTTTTTTSTNTEWSSSISSIPTNDNSTITGGQPKLTCWAEEDQDPAGGMDELLAVLGYRVRSSEMADVAQRLEKLDMVLGSAQDEASMTQLSDTIHYNPSDLSGWVESMLSEINPQNDTSDYDLRAIPGVAAYPPPPPSPPTKRLKTSSECNEFGGEQTSRGVVVVDTQEAGVRLVHTLMACADSVQQGDMKLADALHQRVVILAASQPGAMRKVATNFAEALARRIYSVYPPNDIYLDQTTASDALYMNFYETCPYLKFAHFTANQAILEAFSTSTRVHVIDFGLKQGLQWPALMQALARRPGGPPTFRLTGVGPPPGDGSDALREVGWKLAQFAETIGVEFEFRGFVAESLADIEPGMLELRESETLAVNSVMELHRLLAREGAIERVMRMVGAIRPKIVTVVEQEAGHNGALFLDRFTEALHYYSTMFDSLEVSPPSDDMIMTEMYLGRQICNVVACEGAERVERHERLDRWRERFGSGGFEAVHLGSNVFKQASMLLALFGGREGYRVEENDGCLMLGWHHCPLIATSAWRVADSPAQGR